MNILRVLRQALRSLARHAGTTLVAILSIGVGMGANLALLGWAWSMTYQERDTPGGGRLLWVSVIEPGDAGTSVLPPPDEALALLNGGASWDAVGAWDGSLASVSAAGATGREWVRWTTPGFLRGMGLHAAAGRFFVAGDTLPAGEPVALVSRNRAVARWGSPEAALGETLRVDGVPHRIVGVIGADWDAGEFAVHLPLAASRDRGRHRARMWVHLPESGPDARARANDEIRARLSTLRTGDGRVVGIRTGGEKEVLRSGSPIQLRPFLLPLAVLLLACVNVATVLLARGAARAPALATQRMLGAGAWHVLRPLLAESALLATASAALALLFAEVAFRTILSLPGPDAPRLGIPVLLAAGALVLLVVLAAGAWPAAAALRVRAGDLLRTAHTTGTGGRPLGLRSVLFAVEAALATALVLFACESAGFALAEARRGVGFEPSAMAETDLDVDQVAGGFPTLAAWVDGMVNRVDVVAAGGMTVRPLTAPDALDVDGAPITVPERAAPRAPRLAWITRDLRRALGLPLLRGRDPTTAEFQAGDPVVLINDAAARLLFMDRPSALGARIGVLPPGSGGRITLTVVGIVADMRDQPLFQDDAPPALYTPWHEAAGGMARIYVRGATAAAAENALRGALERNLAGTTPPPVRSTADAVREQTAAPRLQAWLTGAAGTFALLLAALGLFGITALVVAGERRGLGVRAALGAGPLALVAVALRRIVIPVAVGVLAGAGFRALLAGYAVRGAGGMPVHPWLVAAAVVAAALSAAAAPPLWRAAHLDPARTLREE